MLRNHALHLDLEADSRLPEIGVVSVESGVLEERHHTRVELLDDVVEVYFSGFLVVAVLRIPEIDLDASGPNDFGTRGRGPSVEHASRDLHFLSKGPPIGNAVEAALMYRGISVLDSVCVLRPLMRVERAVQIRTVARRQEAAGPDVKLWSLSDLRHGIQHGEFVGDAVVVRAAHESDRVSHRPV